MSELQFTRELMHLQRDLQAIETAVLFNRLASYREQIRSVDRHSQEELTLQQLIRLIAAELQRRNGPTDPGTQLEGGV